MIEFFREWSRPAALSFDLDDTLYANDAVIDAAELYMLEHIGNNYLGGINYTKEMYTQGRVQVLSLVPELAHDVSLLRFFIYQRLLLSRGYSKARATSAASVLLDEFVRVRSQVVVPDEVLRVLSILAKNYPLIAVSNGNIDLKYTSLRELFKFELRPTLNMAGKPASGIFRTAARRLLMPCSMVCHIGDNEVTDVQGAVAAGMKCIWQTGWKGGMEELRVLPNVRITEISDLLELLV